MYHTQPCLPWSVRMLIKVAAAASIITHTHTTCKTVCMTVSSRQHNQQHTASCIDEDNTCIYVCLDPEWLAKALSTSLKKPAEAHYILLAKCLVQCCKQRWAVQRFCGSRHSMPVRSCSSAFLTTLPSLKQQRRLVSTCWAHC